jgi:hypothetical protein
MSFIFDLKEQQRKPRNIQAPLVDPDVPVSVDTLRNRDTTTRERATDGVASVLDYLFDDPRSSQRMAQKIVNPLFDFAPGVGDAAAFEEAESASDLAAATAGVVPGLGELAMFLGPMAKTANKQALKLAQKMDIGGSSPRDILDETGWFKGVDGKWRFEIDDSKSRMLDVDPAKVAPQVKDVLDHPALYDAHPGLADLHVRPTPEGSSFLGQYTPSAIGRPEIKLRPSLKGDERKQTLLHELQHAVQDKEGFQQGTNSSVAKVIKKEQIDRLEAEKQDTRFARRQYERADRSAKQNRDVLKAREYERLAGTGNIKPGKVTGANEFQAIKSDMAKEFGPMPEKAGADRDVWLREALYKMRDRRTSGLDEWDRKLTGAQSDTELKAEYDQAVKDRTDNEAGRARNRAATERQTYLEALDPFEVYRRTAGEVEARQVANRFDLSQEDREFFNPMTVGGRDGMEYSASEQILFDFDDIAARYNSGQLRFDAASTETDTPKIRAYHGSPHDFDVFDISKIGTGEGAQAYGHGLYFADSEDVARSYRDKLAPLQVDNAPIDAKNPKYVAGILSNFHNGDVEKAVAMARKNSAAHASAAARGSAEDGVMAQSFEEAARLLETGEYLQAKPTGKMYEVEINANPDDFLDWDKLLEDQPAAVADRAMPVFEEAIGVKNLSRDQSFPTLQSFVRRDKQGALSEALREAGIPGIKYLDGNSRGAGEGSRNYVVFDDKLINILRKYGIAVPAGMAGYQMTREDFDAYVENGGEQQEQQL